ncbi:MAG: hypothetical protein FWB73_00400 [Treponema sp.]|nr:hypothetical protein [Treponema sp.]
MTEQEKYEKDLAECKENEERNWKLYEASNDYIKMCNERQSRNIEKLDTWIMTVAAGSFGVSFAFIDKIVEIKGAVLAGFLIGGWSCFLCVLAFGFIGFIISSIRNTLAAEEEREALILKYDGKEPEYKNRSVLFDVNIVMGYLQILLFIGGSVCLFLFIGANIF